MPTLKCPDCGGELADGPCPRCLIRLGLDGPGSIPDSRPGDTLPMADRPGSVLATIAATVGAVPHVLLRETAVGEAPSPLFRPTPDARDDSLRYRIDGEIARGGMGTVLRGRDPDLGRDVAIKVLRDDLRGNADLVHRFVEEAQIGGQLQHPGVVPIYELGTFADHRPFFAMKLVRGQTLAEQLADRSTPADDLPRFLATFAAIAQTMAYAHTRGVIHRDLKPSNVMVGSFGEVQVMDWGLAKVLARGGVVDDAKAGKEAGGQAMIATARSGSDADLSHAGSVLGTPSYMPPEQARGETDRIDGRADVFALGSILAEILTGSPAHTGRSSREILLKAAGGDAAEARARLDACGAEADLAALAKDCLASEPEERPGDAIVVADRITAYLDGVQERVHAAIRDRAVAEARAVEERKQRRLQLGLAAAVLGMVGLGAGGFAWTQRQRAEAERVRADRLVRAASVIDDALAESQRLRGEAEAADVDAAPARWALALAAADRAVEHVTQGDADESRTARADMLRRALRAGKQAADDRLARRRQDLDLLKALEAARFAMAEDDADSGLFDDYRSIPRSSRLALDEDYAQAFRDAGLDLGKTEPEAAGAWIAKRSEVGELITYLDDWAWSLRQLDRPRNEVGRLVAAARAADSDPWRNALRTRFVLGRKDDDSFLRTLATDPELDSQTAPNLLLFASQFGPDQLATRLKVLRRAQVRFPGDYWINFELAAAWKRSAADSPNRAGCHAEAVRHYGIAAAIRPGNALVRSHLGNALLAAGSTEEAFSVFRENTRINPRDCWPHYALAGAFYSKGLLEEALAETREAVRINKKNSHIRILLVAALMKQGEQGKKGKLDEAVAECRRAIQLSPNNDNAYVYLGEAFSIQGKLDEATAELRRALRINPKNVMARTALSIVLNDQGKVDEAYDECRRAIRFNPNSSPAHYALGVLLHKHGKHDEAEIEFRESIRLDPNNANLHYNLGSFFGRLGKQDQAGDAYREAIRINPNHDEALYGIGVCREHQEKLAEAIPFYRDAIRANPDNPVYYESLGAAIRQLGDYSGALEAGLKAQALGSKGVNYDLERWLVQTRRMVALAGRLPAILDGSDRPRTDEERVDLAAMVLIEKRYAASARFGAEAMENNPKLGEDLASSVRYNASYAAALAGTGSGKDNPPPDEDQKAKLRGQALGWLRSDLAAWAGILENGPETLRASFLPRVTLIKQDVDLAGVRDAERLARLPEAEREQWRAFWADVDALLARARARGMKP